jgi:hypothetical protein
MQRGIEQRGIDGNRLGELARRACQFAARDRVQPRGPSRQRGGRNRPRDRGSELVPEAAPVPLPASIGAEARSRARGERIRLSDQLRRAQVAFDDNVPPPGKRAGRPLSRQSALEHPLGCIEMRTDAGVGTETADGDVTVEDGGGLEVNRRKLGNGPGDPVRQLRGGHRRHRCHGAIVSVAEPGDSLTIAVEPVGGSRSLRLLGVR